MTTRVSKVPASESAKADSSFHCPACKSEIGAGGRALIKKSDQLEDLEELAREYPELVKNVEALEKEIEKLKEKKPEVKPNVVSEKNGAKPATGIRDIPVPKRNWDW